MTKIRLVELETLKRVWGTETIITDCPWYLGKVLRYEAGKAGGLQYHTEKDETFYLHSGLGVMEHDDGEGNLVGLKMFPGMSCHIPAGAVHRFIAIENCTGFEVSTPHYNDRIRVEEKYGVPVIGDEYGLKSTKCSA